MNPGTPPRRAPTRTAPPGNHLTHHEWDAQFQLLLNRTGGQCEGRTPWCLAPGGLLIGMSRREMSIQHRRARGAGGTDLREANTNLANLLLLCGDGVRGCHGYVEVGERAAAEDRGLWVRHTYDADGHPVPVEDYPLVLWSGRQVFLHPRDPCYVPHPDPYRLTRVRVPFPAGG